jgi:fatty-acyl-CoA synthase
MRPEPAAPQTLAGAIRALAGVRERGFTFLRSTQDRRFLAFGEVHDRALGLALSLRRLGLAPGERVALVLQHVDEIALAFLGAVLGGFVPTIVNPRNAGSAASLNAVQAIVRASRARLVLVSAGRAGDLAGLRESCPQLQWIEEFAAPVAQGAAADWPEPQPDTLCFLQYTSGSTAAPRGVEITQRNVVANTLGCMAAAWPDHAEPCQLVSWLPLFHDMGLIGFFLTAVVTQVPSAILPPSLFARRPALWLELLHELKATATGAPNFAFGYTLRRLQGVDPRRYDLRALRALFCGGEPIHAGSLRAFADWLQPAGFRRECFLPSYGLAETTLAATLHPSLTPMRCDTVSRAQLLHGRAAAPLGGEPDRTLVSCGLPLQGHRVEVVDEAGAALPERTVGEILIRGPSVSSGYFENAAATQAVFRDGWLASGDLGYFADGALYVCGRIKDLIIVRGINHYPQDFEWSVQRLPQMEGRAAVAFASSHDGEEGLTLLAECRAGDEAGEAALCGAIEAAISEEHGVTPQEIRLVPPGALPLTSSGKIQRQRARAMFLAGEFDTRPAVPAAA